MTQTVHYAASFAGLEARRFLNIPRLAADPTTPVDGHIWLNSTDNVIRFREDGATYTLARGSDALDAEQIRDIVGTALVAGNNIDIDVSDAGDTITIAVENLTTADITNFATATNSAIDGRVTKAFVDALGINAATVGNRTAADLTSDALSALRAGNNIDLTPGTGATAGTLEISVEALTTGDLTDYAATTDGRIDSRVTGAFVSGLTGVDADTVGTRDATYLLDRTKHTGRVAPGDALTQATGRLLGRIAGGSGATQELTPDEVTTLLALASADISDFAAAVVTAVNAAPNIDADTLSGQSISALQTAIVNAIVDGSPGTLDTLNELAAALGDDPNFATTITTALAARSRFHSGMIPATPLSGENADAVITHSLGTTRVVAQVYNATTGWEEKFLVQSTSTSTITVRSEYDAIPGNTYEVRIVTAGTS